MKKRVLCFLSLAAFLLVACTMLSAKIEDEMTTQVVVKYIKPKDKNFYQVTLPLSYLYLDQERDLSHPTLEDLEKLGEYHLFQLEEGSGWDDGMRIREVEKSAYTLILTDKALTGFDASRPWTFINSASRRPQVGQKVEIVNSKEKASERYLIFYPERVPEITWKLEGMSIAAQTENILLLEVDEAPQPFIQEQAKILIKELDTLGCQIYSVDTVEQFLKNLPAIAGVAVIFFAAVVIWVQSMLLLKNHWENRWLLTANFVLGLGLLWGLHSLLGQIDLPSDLLPAENIFQWSHYSGEFSQIMSALDETRGSLFDSMKHLGRTGQNTINLAFRITKQVKNIAVLGATLPLLWGVAPLVVRAWPTRKKRVDG